MQPARAWRAGRDLGRGRGAPAPRAAPAACYVRLGRVRAGGGPAPAPCTQRMSRFAATCWLACAIIWTHVIVGASAEPTAPPVLLRPQMSETRAALNLDGLWRVKADPSDSGRMERWWASELGGLVLDAPVPSTLNEVLAADPAANWTDVRCGCHLLHASALEHLFALAAFNAACA